MLEVLRDIAIKRLYGLCSGRGVYPGPDYTKWQYCIFDRLSSRCGPGSVVGIATGYGLHGPGIESRWEARFSTPVLTGPGAHPASCTMGTGSFPGVKSGRGVTLTFHPLPVPWSRKSRAIPLFTLWTVWSLNACTRVHFLHGDVMHETVKTES